MSIEKYIPFMSHDPYKPLRNALTKLRGDADALVLFPYDDGTFFPKRANFDKELLGGMGGYETPDGDKVILDGAGEPKKSLLGVPLLLACDPTEHTSAVEPMKAYMAHKKDLGEWIKVDKRGNIIEAGESLELVGDDSDGPDVDIDVGLEGSMVEDKASELNDGRDPTTQDLQRALETLEQEGDVRKLYDFATPAAPSVRMGDGDEAADAAADGGMVTSDPDVEIEEATHVAVDQSKAADLLPRKLSSEELNVALDKARMQEHDEEKWKRIFVQGAILGAIGMLIGAIVMGGMFFLIG